MREHAKSVPHEAVPQTHTAALRGSCPTPHKGGDSFFCTLHFYKYVCATSLQIYRGTSVFQRVNTFKISCNCVLNVLVTPISLNQNENWSRGTCSESHPSGNNAEAELSELPKSMVPPRGALEIHLGQVPTNQIADVPPGQPQGINGSAGKWAPRDAPGSQLRSSQEGNCNPERNCSSKLNQTQ